MSEAPPSSRASAPSGLPPISRDRPQRCVLCGAEASFRQIDEIPYAAIWEGIRRALDVRLTGEIVERHTVADTTAIYECRVCELHVFHPCVQGDADLYRELSSSPLYYPRSKWEFDWAAGRLKETDVVVDVGCGPGDFLAAIRTKVKRVSGIDINPAAVDAAREQGLTISTDDIERFAKKHAGEYDVACAFQVIAHVADPVRFARALVKCLKPGGRLFVAVPNRLRSGRDAIEALDCPPHRLARWSSKQLDVLAEKIGAKRVASKLEPVASGALRIAFERRIRDAFRGTPDRVGATVGYAVARAVFFPGVVDIYEKGGIYKVLGMHGPSIVAELEVLPEAAAEGSA